MMKLWVVFSCDGVELCRYTLAHEAEGEREWTVGLLAYANGIPEDEIECDIVAGGAHNED